MRKATFFYLLRRGLLSRAGGFVKDGLVMAGKFLTQGLSFPAQGSAEFDGGRDYIDTGSLPLSDWSGFTYYPFGIHVEATGYYCSHTTFRQLKIQIGMFF